MDEGEMNPEIVKRVRQSCAPRRAVRLEDHRGCWFGALAAAKGGATGSGCGVMAEFVQRVAHTKEVKREFGSWCSVGGSRR